MYPRNAASPEPIAIGPVVQISDGAVQTSGCTVRIKPIGVAEGDGSGATVYSTDGIVIYTPTQAETNYTSFILIAKKTGCFPASITIVTTEAAVAGRVSLGMINGDAQSVVDLKDLADAGYDPATHKIQGVVLVDTTTTNTDMRGTNNAALAATALSTATWTNLRAAALDNLDASISSVITAIGNLNNLSALINIYGSPLLEIPDSSSTLFAFTVVTRDNEGKMVDLDSSPTIAAANAAGTSRSANLSVVSHPGTGRYTFTYSVANTATEESLRITVTGAVSAESRYIEWIGAIVNYDTLTQINAIKTQTDKIPNSPAAVGSAMTLETNSIGAMQLASSGCEEIAAKVLDIDFSLHQNANSFGEFVSLLSTQTSVDDLPTNSDLVTALSDADDTVLAAISALSTLVTALGSPAQAGEQMDLVDSPNTNAVDAIVLALLKRDWAGITGEAARSLLNALRAIRNKVAISGPTLTVYKEDDSTPAWTGSVTTNAAADPVTGIDPT